MSSPGNSSGRGGRYTPPHLRSPEPNRIRTTLSSDHTRANTQSSSPLSGTKTPSPPRSPGLSARGNPLWSEIADEETDLMQICRENAPQPVLSNPVNSSSPPSDTQPNRSPPSSTESTQSNIRSVKEETSEPTETINISVSTRPSAKGKEKVPDYTSAEREWHSESRQKSTYSPRHQPWSTSKSLHDHTKPRSQASSSSTNSQSDLKTSPLDKNNSASYMQRNSTDPLDHPRMLHQLENFHITANHEALVSSLAQNHNIKTGRWEKQSHITIEMDDEETGDYIQDLLDTGLIFYFTDRLPSYQGFKSWAETEFAMNRD
jgi:hypothetical protein